MIRPIHPTDTVALVIFGRQACPNEATGRLGRRGGQVPSWSVLLGDWLPLKTQQQAWVSEEGGRISGFISARARPGSTIWEIDRILLAQCETGDTCRELLEGLSQAGSERGIERIFLRLPSQSSLTKAAKQAGFSHYLTEYLYQHEGPIPFEFPELPFRPRTSKDEQGLFQLYSATVPASIRQMEGMTLREWQEIQDGARERRGRQELLAERDASILAWLKLADEGGTGFFEMTVRPSEEGILLGVIGHALAQFRDKARVSCLVPEFQERLRLLLDEHGFQQVAEHVVLARQLAARVKQHALAPARA